MATASDLADLTLLRIGPLADPGDPATVAAAFVRAAPSLADVPLPGSGRTAVRFRLLAAVAEASPALARLVEGHLDALAILAELGTKAPPEALLGVWAAEPAGLVVHAHAVPGGWRLEGAKPYASGADHLTHALLTARAGNDRLLFLVPREQWAVEHGTWRAVGMAGSESPTVTIDAEVADESLVGGDRAYLRRPGFWHGGVGVAAVWYGGAVGVTAPLRAAARAGALSPHALAHFGGVEVALSCGGLLLADAAAAIDADPLDARQAAQLRARTVRARIEQVAAEALDRVGRALGAGPLCHDRAHARRVADLTVYIRQSHAEADLEELGRLVAAGGG